MPACFMYSNYLLRMASLAPVEEAVASLLPCFWVYAEVGRQMAERVVLDEHPYQEWIALYAGEQFAASAEAAIKITNALANSASEVSQKNMLAAFQKSTQLEWLFWHEAYHQANFQQIL
jgi:thiaminase/transcriptional activator TenA